VLEVSLASQARFCPGRATGMHYDTTKRRGQVLILLAKSLGRPLWSLVPGSHRGLPLLKHQFANNIRYYALIACASSAPERN